MTQPLLKPAKALINAIAVTQTSNHYGFFLGAGCSISSGVRPVPDLIREWRAHRFLLDPNCPRLEKYTATDVKLLAEFCSKSIHTGTDRWVLNQRDNSYIKIYQSADAEFNKQDKLVAQVEDGFVDKRGNGLRFSFSNNDPITISTHEPQAAVFSISNVKYFADAFTNWLVKQSWYDKPQEYSILFEYLYQLPTQRQAFIEKEVEFARPYWGYLYLANMMSISLFDVCFTTNFDDLLNDAFTTFVGEGNQWFVPMIVLFLKCD